MVDPAAFTITTIIALSTCVTVTHSAADNVFPEYIKVLPSPLVCLLDGCIIGTTRSALEGYQFEAFFGIPYAKPPLGKLRFKDPVQVESWVGNYDATFERSKCIQKNDARPQSFVEGSEDCLYLNLYRPLHIGEKLPVIVYIHGGSYASGSASFAEYGPERLMDTKKVLVVVIQYRLGVFGFLSTDDISSPGNYGLKDQSMAMRWVQRNIKKFGGDPNRVTLVGQSAGGAAVQMHMMSHLSRGTFQQAVSMSGTALAYWNYNIDQARVARRQAAVLGIPAAYKMSTEKLVETLRWVDAVELGKSIDRLKYFYVHPTALYQPVMERHLTNGTFLSEDPRALWSAGKFQQIPWITGTVPNDGAADSLGIITNVTLLKQLNEMSRKYIPRLAGGDDNAKATQMLKNRFFQDGTDDRWLTANNFLHLQDLLTESTITYPTARSVKQHLALKKNNKSPIGVYYFNFKGRYSQSYSYSYTTNDFGVCHSDELLYLFRNTAVGADFPSGSPEAIMAKSFVEYFVKIAYEGIPGPTCRNKDCQILEFTNSENPKAPVVLSLVNGFNEDMYKFWQKYYSLQGI
ncbi:juvenile hormone esterase-like [Culex pipiens pallens]|uniref:juvenile hormone esterase-like n=1 Tax=Culex pipiens pallens TaxID=42434 RepID=UPI001953CD01|nr:juvenile hormone esterase-like [Culex pipiens pallens]